MDSDLPGDDTFQPAPPVVGLIIDTPHGPAWGGAMTVSAKEQAAIHHNQLRYAELQKLRLGLPNRYHASRYR